MSRAIKNAAALQRGAKRYFDSISLTEPVEGSKHGAVRTVWLEPPTLEGLCLQLRLTPIQWSAYLEGSCGEELQRAALWAELVLGQYLALELLGKAKGTDGAKLLWQQSGARLWSGREAAASDSSEPALCDLEGKERVLRQIFDERQ